MNKIKLIAMTAMLTLSFGVVTEAAVLSQTEQVVEIESNSQDVRSNLADIPFINILESTISLFYPPLEFWKKEPMKYTVEEGDNLFRIALNHGMSLQELMSLNNLTDHLIFPGDILTISSDGDATERFTLSNTVKVAFADPEDHSEKEPEAAPKVPAFNLLITSPPEDSTGTEMIVTATAYTAYCTGCSGTTAYGIDLRANPDQKVIAVDPTIIPLGTKVWVEGYGEAIAGDVGSAIKGHKIDVFIPSYESAMEWGVKKVKIKIIN
ncbi:3D domain-containing protein [Sporosarcina sp. UB5]|uniref:3D domain-containing protein n=1 Tax=Sporosarcina sp. UB5 TaxID=3047463 RepID=UPI003D79B302